MLHANIVFGCILSAFPQLGLNFAFKHVRNYKISIITIL